MLTRGQNLNLAVTASGNGPLAYKWFFKGKELSGEIGSSYAKANAGVADSGWYVADVTDSDGTTRSKPLFVIVTPTRTQVRAWGAASTDQISVPADLNDAAGISAGLTTALALKADGTVVQWGDSWGDVPAGLNTAVAVAASYEHMLALKADGTVVGWGWNTKDQLTFPNDLTDVVGIATGTYHNLALKADGSGIAMFPSSSGGNVGGGQEVSLIVQVQNSGTKSWGASHYLVLKDSSGANVAFISLDATPPSGVRNVTVRFVSPTSAGNYTYTLQALENGVAWFGPVANLQYNVTVAALTNRITFGTHTLPSSVAPGATVTFNYPVTNSGTKSWGANHYLTLKDSAGNNMAFAPLATTSAGASKTMTYSFTAPATPGTYTYKVQALENGVEFFGSIQTLTLTVSNAAPNAITFNSDTFPPSATTGSTVSFNFTVTNSGTKIWGANHYLTLKDGAGNNMAFAPLATTVPGVSRTMSYIFTVPASPGTYTYKVQALENGVEFFGSIQTLTLTVTAAAPNAITYNSHTFPSSAIAGSTISFNCTITNSGTKTWGASHYLVLKDNAGNNLLFATLGTTMAGASKTVSFTFPAPASAGSYTYKVEALDNGVEWFGAVQNLPLNVASAALREKDFPASAHELHGDFDQDGQLDQVVANSVTGRWELWLSSAEESSSVDLASLSEEWVPVDVLDYDHDGYPDLLWQSDSSGKYRVWLMAGPTVILREELSDVP